MARTRQRAFKYAEKSQILNARITPNTRNLLEQAASRSGRTVSAECEFQLQRALVTWGEGPTHAVMATIGRSIDTLMRMRGEGKGKAAQWRKDPKARWWNDPYLYTQATQAAAAMFEAFRPAGAPPETFQDILDAGGRRQGRFVVETTLREIQLTDLSIPFEKHEARQRWLTTLKRDLGELVERPRPFRFTAEENRQLNQIARAIDPLRLRAEMAPEELTPDEREEVSRLRAEEQALLGRRQERLRAEEQALLGRRQKRLHSEGYRKRAGKTRIRRRAGKARIRRRAG
jgi:hypothetical protein